ncbi:isochorismatase [Biscogniauxia marginata]|nr:isochorismatase [Biscogniauxia marginata]
MNFARPTISLSTRGTRLLRFTPPSPTFCCYQPARRKFSQTMSANNLSTPQRRLQNPAIFVCDIQEKFRKAIWQFDKILFTSQKVLRAAQILKIPIYVTTQIKAKLGDTVPELQELVAGAVSADKTRFSMMVPEVAKHFPVVPTTQLEGRREVVIVGLESHVCVTQTALDLRARGHKVYVLADGVSSCNEQEVPIALARLRAEGVTVTTSESWLYECMGNAEIAEFRDITKLVKETGEGTKTALGALFSKI